MHACMCVCVCVRARVCHTHTLSPPYTFPNNVIHTYTSSSTLSQLRRTPHHTHTPYPTHHTPCQDEANAHARTHARTHTRTHARTHARPHAHARKPAQTKWYSVLKGTA